MTEHEGREKSGWEEAVGQAGELADEFEGASPYSKDYWDGVFEQLGRRPLVKAALAVLAVMYALAIYAPFLASDRPLMLSAIDYKEYTSAQRSLYPVSMNVGRLAKTSEEDWLAKLSDSAKIRTYAGALDNEWNAIVLRVDTMRSYLEPEQHPRLNAFQAKVRDLIEEAREGGEGQVESLATETKDEAKALRTDYAPLPRGETETGEEPQVGVALKTITTYPLFESTTWLEIFFMVLWVFVLGWPLWNRLLNRRLLGGDRERIRKWRRRKLAGVLGTSVLAALFWQLTVGGEMTFEAAAFKGRLTKQEIVPERVVFTPLAMGFAEIHAAENFRPPTWNAKAEISEEGYYVRGSRVPRPDPSGYVQPPNPVDVRYGEPERNSPVRHLFGTDSLGRDLLVRMLWGGRISLAIGILSTVLLVSIGVVIGSIAGYFGGRTDITISRIIEIVQSFPAFFLILTAVSIIPEDKLHPIFAIVVFIAVVRWTGVARLVRGEFLKLKEQDFVLAARTLGFSPARVIFRHVLPNAMGPVLVSAAFSVAAGILTESAISFLGLGVKLPIPSWGSLLNETRVAEYWWIQIFPGVLIFVTVFCYNLVGEGLRDAMDPKMKV